MSMDPVNLTPFTEISGSMKVTVWPTSRIQHPLPEAGRVDIRWRVESGTNVMLW